MIRILLVEDERKLQEIVMDYFTDKGKGQIEIICASRGDEGLLYAENEDFDLIFLDVMIPEPDGFTICRELRRIKNTPIIFLTAKSREEDILHGYEIGCDDYVVKPFLLSELFAKSNALIRRNQGFDHQRKLSVGEIMTDLETGEVQVQGKEIRLPLKEREILRYLMENHGRVVPREKLLLRIWGYDYEGNERVIDNHIKKLRKALGRYGDYIVTISGRGYCLQKTDKKEG